MLAETTDGCTFADAVRDGRLWVALTENTPVGFALAEMLADDLPHLEEMTSSQFTGAAGWGPLWSELCVSGRRCLDTPR